MTSEERLRRRRCLGLRVGVLFAILLGVYSRGDWAVLGVVAAAGLLALSAYWRSCRRTGAKPAETGTHQRESQS
jgi:uncharacterized membrane protein YebE (DUF533 family)